MRNFGHRQITKPVQNFNNGRKSLTRRFELWLLWPAIYPMQPAVKSWHYSDLKPFKPLLAAFINYFASVSILAKYPSGVNMSEVKFDDNVKLVDDNVMIL